MQHLLLATALICTLTSNAQPKVIPFTYDGHLYISATLNDSLKGRFLFDTGAGMTLIDSTFLSRSIKPKNIFDITLSGLGNNKVEAKYTTDSIKFTSNDYTSLCKAAVITALSKLVPLECDGILSVHHFGDTIYKIDFLNQNFEILNNIDSLVGYTKIPYRTSDHNGFIEFTIEAIIDSTHNKVLHQIVHLDTGNPNTVDFAPNKSTLRKMVKQLGRSITTNLAMRGVGGGGTSRIIELQGVRIGGHLVKAEYGTIIENAAMKNTKTKKSTGIIGNSIMDHFDIIIDRPNKNLYIRPNSTFSDIIPARYIGAYISRLDFPARLLVNGLKQGYNGPLQQGDIITHINNLDANSLTGKEINSYTCMPDKEYTLTITRGAETLKFNIINLNTQTLWQ